MIDFSAYDIARATGGNPVNVGKYWPLIREALARKGVNGRFALVGAIATVRVEAGSKFAPISELGNEDSFTQHYELNKKVARALGNIYPGDGARFHGRGFIQITGRSNYSKYGKEIGIDLIKDPDKANDPEVAAAIFAAYYRDHGIDVWAEKAGKAPTPVEAKRNWQMVRKLVNGGINGWELFYTCVTRLLQIDPIKIPDVPAVQTKPVVLKPRPKLDSPPPSSVPPKTES